MSSENAAGAARSAGRRITEQLTGEALRATTGRDWDEWFALLDGWGATGRTHAEIARHLVEVHQVPGWHAQSVTVGYEQERGMRQVGQSSSGDWQASVSKMVNASAAAVIDAFADDSIRRRWLPESGFRIRTQRPAKSLTADWDGGASRISVYLTIKGDGRIQVGLGHTHLPDAEAVAASKAFWKERLAALKRLLETP
ncbi:hypothetical protein QCN29_33675 [Streptomyces sp. HNM0663]|uniref:DUF4287 domain-containing protein n=1 Tax=Streptomyces chengmaiensis TaxID=3040919 RepID=A0ABT6HY52_9ACTN|nr:hypothetical protein [Streptomyces chengmaiensis]MDH2393627.1 hypothetical protein [Streptomyces chengmaiensis]